MLNNEEKIAFRNKINLLFKQLRKLNIVCRKNYLCCASCGHASMEQQFPADEYVFYHNQEHDHLKEGRDVCYMQHFISEANKPAVIKILEIYGFKWNGDDSKTFVIPYMNSNLSQ
jgi:hypothetical protein